ncbi:MAG: DUF1282 domain-containing protein [Verrucomicrobia bacterium]|nr:DUF1282 domain-containing protein [Verrucomicrobiota bacterium]
MMKVFQLLFAPFTTWSGLAEARRGAGFFLVFNLLTLAAAGSAIEGLGLYKLGLKSGLGSEGSRTLVQDFATVLRYEQLRLALDLAVVLVGAQFVFWVARGLHFNCRFFQALLLMAYSIGPLLLLRMADGIPHIPTWVCYAVGVFLSLNLLYNGVAAVLQPDRASGFGLFLLCAMILLLFTGVAHFVAVSFLTGNLKY